MLWPASYMLSLALATDVVLTMDPFLVNVRVNTIKPQSLKIMFPFEPQLTQPLNVILLWTSSSEL